MNTKITITIETDCEDLNEAEIVATTMKDSGTQGLRSDRETQNCKVFIEHTSTSSTPITP